MNIPGVLCKSRPPRLTLPGEGLVREKVALCTAPEAKDDDPYDMMMMKKYWGYNEAAVR